MVAKVVCLDPSKPIARQYEWEGINESMTEPDLSMGLARMVMTGVAGAGSSSLYNYPDLGDDDEENHDSEDYMKMNQSDIVEKEAYVKDWMDKFNSKKDEKEKETPSGKVDAEAETGDAEKAAGKAA